VGVSLKLVAGLLRVLLGVAGSGGSSGKDSLAYIQLEKHNERLKEALIKYILPQYTHGIRSLFCSDCETCPRKQNKSNVGEFQRWRRISLDLMIFNVRKSSSTFKYIPTI
jgi:hypothetical protein